MMKRIDYILLLAVLLLVSCTKEQIPTNENESMLPISYGYMQFSTGVSSRTQLATDMKEKNFGILGYKYSKTTDWGAAKSLATPDVFYNQLVSCGDNGICTYDTDNTKDGNQLKPWEDNIYTYFAYHPYNGTGITLSNATTTNTPTLTYTYGWLNPTAQSSWYYDGVIEACHESVPIFDLMTAEAIDVSGSGDGRVALDFKHRLYAIEILANNYNENEYEYELDEDGNIKLDINGKKIYKLDGEGNKIIVESARQQISNLELTLEGLTNTSMTIPMSMQEEENKPIYNATSVGTRKFMISNRAVMVPAFNETTEDGRGAGVATSISQMGSRNGGYLMLIPQAGTNSGIKGTLNWAELSNFSGDVNKEFTSTIDFQAGKLYQIYINFVGSGITIALIEAGAWDVLDLTHTFE